MENIDNKAIIRLCALPIKQNGADGLREVDEQRSQCQDQDQQAAGRGRLEFF